MNKTFDVKKVNCPVCEAELDAATPVGDDESRPDPGDFTVCIQCAAILQFAPDHKLVQANPRDLETFSRNQPNDFHMLRMTVMAVRKRMDSSKAEKTEPNEDQLMILLSHAEYTTLLIALGYAAAAAKTQENQVFFLEFVKLANAVNRFNPGWAPYTIPKDVQ